MNKNIQRITEDERSILLKKSVWGLSDRPKEMGKSSDEIKRAFWAAYLDREHSLLAEINRVIDEINRLFAERAGEGEGAVILHEGCSATGKNSTAAGVGTVADCDGMLAAGRYNRPTGGDVLWSLGCGSDEENRDNAVWVEMVDGEPRLYFRGGEFLSEELVTFLAELATGSFLLGQMSLEVASVHAEEDIEAEKDVRGENVEAKKNVRGKNLEAEETVCGREICAKEEIRGKKLLAEQMDAKNATFEEMKAPKILADEIQLRSQAKEDGEEGEAVKMRTEVRDGKKVLVLGVSDIVLEHGDKQLTLTELVDELSWQKKKKRRTK